MHSKTEKGFSCGTQNCMHFKSKTGNLISWNYINILDEQVRGTKERTKLIEWKMERGEIEIGIMKGSIMLFL